MIKATLALTFIILSPLSFAKSFKNSFIQFNLPDQWECQLAGATWNCSNKYESKKKSAIIVFAAKKAGPQDTLNHYKNQIKSKPGITIEGKKHFQSKSIKIQTQTINQQKWIDGLSYNSEAPDYYTRYLATVKDKIAIIVTFTSHRNDYTTIVSDFINAINSLVVLKPATAPSENPIKTQTKINNDMTELDLDPISLDDDVIENDESSPFLNLQNFALLLLLLITATIFFKKKK